MAKANRSTDNAKQRKSAISKLADSAGTFLSLINIAEEYTKCPFDTTTMMRCVRHLTADVRASIVECAKRLQDLGTDTEAPVYLKKAEAMLSHD